MEILVVALAALATLLLPLAVLMAEGIVLAASALAGFASIAVEATRKGSWKSAWESRKQVRVLWPRFSRWARRVAIATVVLLVATLCLVVALNTVLFEWSVRQTLSAAQRHNGIDAEFGSANGSLFSGQVRLNNAVFVRQGHPVSDFDLEVDDFQFKADIWKALFGQYEFDEVTVAGVRGTFTRNGKRDPSLPRRRFAIERLTVENLSIEVADESRPPHRVSVPLEVTTLEITDFRSTWAAFDLLFRSSCEGLISGQPFAIIERSGADDVARETQWVARNLPVHVLSGYLTGPLSWLVDGQLDVDVTTRWQSRDEDPEMHMHCYLVAHDFAANVPDDLALLQKAVVAPALEALNRSTARLPLEFEVTMRKDAFRGQLSPLAAGLADVLSQGSGRAFTTLFPNAAERIGDRVDRIRSRIRGLMRPDRPDEEEAADGEPSP